MAKKNVNWIPGREDALVDLMSIWQVKLPNASLQTAYGWIAAECTATVAAIAAFLSARTAYQAAPTKANYTQKEETKKTAVEALRKFARERIRNNPKMTHAQRQELGVTVPDPEPTPVPVPDKGPESEAETSAQSPGVVKVRYVGAKPYGVDRVEIAWVLADTPVDSPEQLPNKESFPRNPWERTFGHEDRGKKLHYALRYLTKEGASHWSDVREAVVP
ncbi:MAG: hypothetical protein LBF50_09010 [Azoarcus sp.]|nr:hypothetical protein [Azoarcus sp.]